MKTPVLTVDFVRQLQALQVATRREILSVIELMSEGGSVEGIEDFGDHKRFPVGDIVIHVVESEEICTFYTMHRLIVP